MVPFSNFVNIRAVHPGAFEGGFVPIELQRDDVVHEADGEPHEAAVDHAQRFVVVLYD